MLFKHVFLQTGVEFVIQAVLFPYCFDKHICQTAASHLRRNNKIIFQPYVSLRFFGVGAETEFFYLLHNKTGYAYDIDIEDGMFGNRTVTHTENDIAVGLSRLLDISPRDLPQFIDRQRISTYTGISGGDSLRGQAFSPIQGRSAFLYYLVINVVTCQYDFHEDSPGS